jgi:hypothetical protein
VDADRYAALKEAYQKAIAQPYDAVTHATHIRAAADTMHRELLRQIDHLMGAEPYTPEAKNLLRLVTMVEEYESVRFTIEDTRAPSSSEPYGCPTPGVCSAAARIAELEDALRPFANIPPVHYGSLGKPEEVSDYWCEVGSPLRTHFSREDRQKAVKVLNNV